MTGLRMTVHDGVVVAKRYLTHIPRVPELLVFATIQPIMFVLLFTVVFGKAIPLPPALQAAGIDYKNFMMPGIFVQTVAFTAGATAVGLAEDLNKGLIDRFRSLPMARSAVLIGRTFSDVVRDSSVIVVMMLVALIVGFRFTGSPIGVVVGLGLLVLFSFSFAWIGAWIGLSVRSPEVANTAGFIWLFPLTFLSTAFVPLQSLPGWLQPIANHTPVTVTVEALRGLFLGGPLKIAQPLLESLGWTIGILIIFLPLAVRQYKRAAGR